MDSELQRAFTPFLGRDRTVSQAAEEANVKPNTMYIRVKRLEALGLLKLVRKEPRKGRAIKVYRSVADRLYVPYEAMSFSTREAMQEELDARWERELRRSIVRARLEAVPTWGYEVYRDERGDFVVHPATAPGERLSSSRPTFPAVINLWSEDLSLDFEDAKAMQGELYRLYERYRAKPGAQRYLFRVGLAPWVKG